MNRLLRVFLSPESLHFLRIDWHFMKVRIANRLSPIADRRPKARYLNIGCGPHGRPDDTWFNIDGWPASNVHATLDLRRSLPFPDRRFDGIYCEHFFEHLPQATGASFLKECRRILKPGGVLRLSVPDGRIYIERYLTDRTWMLKRRGGTLRTPMEVMNVLFRQGLEHQYIYDAETLVLRLQDAGFSSAAAASFGSGRDPNLLLDQEKRAFESLYVEAVA